MGSVKGISFLMKLLHCSEEWKGYIDSLYTDLVSNKYSLANVPSRFLAPARSFLAVGPSPVFLNRAVCIVYLSSSHSIPFSKCDHFIDDLCGKSSSLSLFRIRVYRSFLEVE